MTVSNERLYLFIMTKVMSYMMFFCLCLLSLLACTTVGVKMQDSFITDSEVINDTGQLPQATNLDIDPNFVRVVGKPSFNSPQLDLHHGLITRIDKRITESVIREIVLVLNLTDFKYLRNHLIPTDFEPLRNKLNLTDFKSLRKVFEYTNPSVYSFVRRPPDIIAVKNKGPSEIRRL